MGLAFPKEPPEGLLEAADARMSETHALFYEPVWLPDQSLEAVLSDRVGRKVKYVRCSCSACKGEAILPWVPHDEAHGGYGFLTDVHGGYEPVGSGDEIFCPQCGALVHVKKAAEVGRDGSFVTTETMLMSASVVGEERHLVLTGWHVERRIFRNLNEKLIAQPAEAYEFRAGGCEKHVAWVTIYGGYFGYKTAYRSYWTTPQRWSESWGAEDTILGLTPELIERSCLPNCKLDFYMREFTGISKKYPVMYLRLYQKHSNVENLLLHGLPLVLDDLLGEADNKSAERKKYDCGMPKIKAIDWSAARPSKMLGLTRDELALGQDMTWGAYFWRLYLGAKRRGEILTRETLDKLVRLGEENALKLLTYGVSVRRVTNYLYAQYEIELEKALLANDDAYSYEYENQVLPDVTMLLDYWDMCRKMDRNLDNTRVRYPRELIEAHDDMVEAVRIWTTEQEVIKFREAFRERFKELSRFSFACDGLTIIPAETPDALKDEGDRQHHCVFRYAASHAKGSTAIFFLRRTAAPDMPYYTLEFDEKKLRVRQNRGYFNCERTDEIWAFEKLWLEWVRAGCRRSKNGEPILPKREKVIA